MKLQRKLGLKDGIALGIGSIIGSGILFLPSLTAEISGIHTFWVWILTTLFCLPLLFIFSDMAKFVANESGIEGCVAIGLGKRLSGAIPVLLLGTVCFGMPASALIVGEYVQKHFHASDTLGLTVAVLIVLTGGLTNIIGIKIGSGIQITIAILTLCMGAAIPLILQPNIPWTEASSISHVKDMNIILPGVLIAFWAYAGFENMSFIASEFKNPNRDFILSMIITLVICGLLYWSLSLTYLYLNVNETNASFTGLLAMMEGEGDPKIPFFSLSITAFAFLAVQLNFNSWIWGISRLIYSCAKQGKLPHFLGKLNKKQLPANAVFSLVMLFVTVLLGSFLFDSFLEFVIPLISANFVFIYMLVLLSYIRLKKSGLLKWVALFLFSILVPVLLMSGLGILYPIMLCILGTVFLGRSHHA